MKTKEEYEKAINDLEEKEKQLERQLKREENKINYFKERDRKKRAHRLIVKGGIVESILPELKDVDEEELYSAMQLFFEDSTHKNDLYSHIASLKGRHGF